jgi:ELWxxDGT repeat protein
LLRTLRPIDGSVFVQASSGAQSGEHQSRRITVQAVGTAYCRDDRGRPRLMNSHGFSALLALAAAGVVGAAPLPPLTMTLVKDSDTQLGQDSSNPAGFRTIGGLTYFAATTAARGRELYATDGTAGGLRLVKDLAEGPVSSEPGALGAVGAKLIVDGTVPPFGRQMFSIDASGEAVRLTAQTELSGTFTPIASLGSRLVTAGPGSGIWSTDGTLAGTVKLSAAPGFPVEQYDGMSCRIGARLVLAGGIPFQGERFLAATDGTVAGSSMLTSLGGYDPHRVLSTEAIDGQCYFLVRSAGSSWRLWATDGSAAGTRQLASGNGTAGDVVMHAGALYISDMPPGRYRVMRRTTAANGTLTTLVDNAFSGSVSYGLPMASSGGKFVHVAPFQNGANTEVGLFIGNGTPGGTQRITSFGSWSGAEAFYEVDGGLLFGTGDTVRRLDTPSGTLRPDTVNTRIKLAGSIRFGSGRIGAGATSGGQEVAVSDGTETGTRMLHDVWATTRGLTYDAFGQSPVSAITAGDVLYVSAFKTDILSRGIMRIDGTAAGTRELPRNTYGSQPVNAIAATPGGIVFSSGSSSNVRLYRADMQLTGATALTPLLNNGGYPMVSAGDAVVLTCRNPSGLSRLCGLDANGGQTDLAGLSLSTRPADNEIMGHAGNVLLLRHAWQNSVWRTDGTVPGTFEVSPPVFENYPVGARYPRSVALGGRVYFIVCASAAYCELMSTDGSVAGTTSIAPLPNAPVASIATAGGRVVFVFATTGSASQLWSSDGTAAGTGRIALLPAGKGNRMVSVGRYAHLPIDCDTCAERYVVTDGTADGTRNLPTPPTLAPTFDRVFDGSGDVLFAVGGAAAVFTCKSQATGTELCIASADGLRIRLLSDTYPGAASSRPILLGSTQRAAYVLANDGAHGAEIWRVAVADEAIFGSGFE